MEVVKCLRVITGNGRIEEEVWSRVGKVAKVIRGVERTSLEAEGTKWED